MTAPLQDHQHGTVATSRIAIDVVEDAGDWSTVATSDQLSALILEAVCAVDTCVADDAWPGTALTVSLSDDANVAELNERFRGKPKPTNVLSFPPGPASPPDQLGDIVLALETVTREALEQDISQIDHVRHLVVHGVLHLIGYDHETADDAEEMEALEVKILEHLGVDNPYRDRMLEE